MRRILTATLVAILALSFVACGEDEPGDDFVPAVVIQFELDLDRAVASGRIDRDADRSEIVAETLAVVRDRLKQIGLQSRVDPFKADGFEVKLPKATQLEQDAVVGLVTTLGSLMFRIEVLPESKGDDWGKEPRKLWTGSKDEFDEYKRKQVESWRAAESEGKVYRSDDARYFLVKEDGTDGSDDAHYHLVEKPKPGQGFDGTMLKNARVSQDQFGKAVVNFDVKEKYQSAFKAWTTENVGVPMAILLNGEYMTAPRINSPLTDNVQITLGNTSFEESQREAKELAMVLESGPLPVRPRLVSIEHM